MINYLERLYLLSCIFAPDDGTVAYRFSDISLPQLFYGKFEEFALSLEPIVRRKLAFDFIRIRPIRQSTDFKAIGDRPTPPAIWHKADVEFVQEWELHHWLGRDSIAGTIRTFYSHCFVILEPNQPLLHTIQNMKRAIDDEVAISCAIMKECGHTYKKIGQEFGWPLQEDNYGKLTRCSTARRYVKRGRVLLEEMPNSTKADLMSHFLGKAKIPKGS